MASSTLSTRHSAAYYRVSEVSRGSPGCEGSVKLTLSFGYVTGLEVRPRFFNWQWLYTDYEYADVHGSCVVLEIQSGHGQGSPWSSVKAGMFKYH
jgi:hypothetical protein